MKLVLSMLITLCLLQPVAAAEWPDEIVTLHSTLEMARQDLLDIDCSKPDVVPNQDARCGATRESLLQEVVEAMDRIENDSDAGVPLSSNVIGDAHDIVERTYQFIGD